MRPLGLWLEYRIHYGKTVALYREVLALAGMVDVMFRQFDGYLARQKYIARDGQIPDAPVMEVPRNHNTGEENK